MFSNNVLHGVKFQNGQFVNTHLEVRMMDRNATKWYQRYWLEHWGYMGHDKYCMKKYEFSSEVFDEIIMRKSWFFSLDDFLIDPMD